MQTHFSRRKKKSGYGNRLSSPLESVVIHVMPDDRLVTLDEAYKLVQLRCKAERMSYPTKKNLLNILTDLCVRGFLVEVHGTRITRVLEEVA
jgi:hypothetical protein